MSALALAGGIGAAVVAAACFDGAVALQAGEARREEAHGVARLGLLVRLLRRPRWVAATLLAALGWPFQIAALSLAPLTVVQPTLAVGLIVLLALGSRILHERPRPADWLAVLSIIAGVALLAWAAPEHTHAHAGTGSLVASLAALSAVTLVPFVVHDRLGGWLQIAGAGAAYTGTALLTKLLADALDAGSIGLAIVWVALVAALAVAGMASEMSALQRRPAASVASPIFAIQTIVPVLLAPLLAGESWSATPLGGGAIGVGVLLVTAGAAVLGTAPAVGALVAASHQREHG